MKNFTFSPFWNSNLMKEETVAFIEGDMSANLLFAPAKILSVTSYDYTKKYVEDKDFTISGNKITLTDNTTIPFWKKEVLYGEKSNSEEVFLPVKDKFLFFSSHIPNDYQIRVTYEHTSKWNKFIPQCKSENLPITMSKLKNRQELKIGFFGDSITEGYGSSKKENIAPFNKPYTEIFMDMLQNKFNSKVTCENVALAGMNSVWGSEHTDRFTIVPDLAIIAFGMNDGCEKEEFISLMQTILNKMREKNKDMEFIFISAMTSNPEVESWLWHKNEFEKALYDFADKNKGIVISPMNSMSLSLYEQGKKFIDINSNNINHPNDFLHKIYADVLFQTAFNS